MLLESKNGRDWVIAAVAAILGCVAGVLIVMVAPAFDGLSRFLVIGVFLLALASGLVQLRERFGDRVLLGYGLGLILGLGGTLALG